MSFIVTTHNVHQLLCDDCWILIFDLIRYPDLNALASVSPYFHILINKIYKNMARFKKKYGKPANIIKQFMKSIPAIKGNLRNSVIDCLYDKYGAEFASKKPICLVDPETHIFSCPSNAFPEYNSEITHIANYRDPHNWILIHRLGDIYKMLTITGSNIQRVTILASNKMLFTTYVGKYEGIRTLIVPLFSHGIPAHAFPFNNIYIRINASAFIDRFLVRQMYLPSATQHELRKAFPIYLKPTQAHPPSEYSAVVLNGLIKPRSATEIS